MTLKAQLARIRESEHFVYRCFDTKGELLYVGCSINPDQRLWEHGYFRSWWADRIARVTLESFPDQAAGLAAEKRAIQTEHPIHNRAFRTTESQRSDWQPQHYINWLTAYLEDPTNSRTSAIVRREIKRAAGEYSARFGRDLRKDVGRVRVGYTRCTAVQEAKWGPSPRQGPKWRVA